ncbi:MAG: hypothetical protein ACLPL5_04150, partial [Stellaceae bacterium]
LPALRRGASEPPGRAVRRLEFKYNGLEPFCNFTRKGLTGHGKCRFLRRFYGLLAAGGNKSSGAPRRNAGNAVSQEPLEETRF